MATKYLNYIIIALLGIFLSGCSDTESLQPSRISDSEISIVGDQVILSTSIEVAGFRQASTRSFQENPILENLHLYLIEFVDNNSPLMNTLSNVYHATEESVDADNSLVKYKVTLNKTDQARILHLIAVADEDLQVPYGVEASVMPGLVADGMGEDGDGIDAYWRRLEFPVGYCIKEKETDDDGNETGEEVWVANADLKEKLIEKNVKLVRNFAKITVGVAEDVNFTLEGFYIVNTPLKGTMAPYSASNRLFPEFLDKDDKPLPYQEVANKYSGISPANTGLANQVTSGDAALIPTVPSSDMTTVITIEKDNDGNEVEKHWNCLPSKYIYERNFTSISRTFIIIKGRYGDNESTYYKLDLGNNDNDGIFRYYGLLRNYNYFLKIKEVRTNGYATSQAAAEGTVYNNISFDIDTDHLINMSDGTDIIRVNLTTAVITDNDSTIVFRYAYKAGIREPNNGTYNNGLATFIDLKPGNVILSINPENPNSATDTNLPGDNTPWRQVTIKCKNPTSVTETQEFTIVNTRTGLGRTISLVSHFKWEFENLYEFARIWENYPETYKGLETYNPDNPSEKNPHGTDAASTANSTYAGLCGTEVGSQFTIFFDIPDNIPEVLFPLEFTIESDLQGLENEPMGTIVVRPGPSLFPDNQGENRIQYIKSVSWTEYNSPLKTDARDDNGTLIENTDGGPNTHRVRCRFRTIETVTDNTHVNIKIANINFNTADVSFTRTDAANNLRGPGLTGTPSN